MDYITSLRRHMGHAPLLMVAATTLIVDAENRLLMLKRSDSGCWSPPGGAVELGEVVETAARREVREEAGLELNEISLYGVFSGPEQFHRYPNGDEVYNVNIVYLASYIGGGISLNSEHTAWDWFAPDHIPGMISPPIQPVIARFLKTHGKINTPPDRS